MISVFAFSVVLYNEDALLLYSENTLLLSYTDTY